MPHPGPAAPQAPGVGSGGGGELSGWDGMDGFRVVSEH